MDGLKAAVFDRRNSAAFNPSIGQLFNSFRYIEKGDLVYNPKTLMSNVVEKKKIKKNSVKWTRTTVLIRDDHLEKFKVLAWWEKSTIKDLFDEMIESYLSSKGHIDHLVNERNRNLEKKDGETRSEKDKSLH